MPAAQRSTRVVLLATLAIALVSVVAAASRPGDQAGSLGPTATIATALLHLLIASLVIAVALVAIALMGSLIDSLSRMHRRHQPEDEIVQERVPVRAGAAIVLLFVSLLGSGAMVAIAYLTIETFRRPMPIREIARASAAAASITHSPTATRPAGIPWDIPPAAIALALVAVLVAVLVAIVASRPRAWTHDDDPVVVRAGSTGSTIDLSFPTEGEPRRAVIAAWAWVERVLSRDGVSRAASEAPLEYAERVAAERPGRATAIEWLAQLYERASFSPHHIDAATRDAAFAAAQEIAVEEP